MILPNHKIKLWFQSINSCNKKMNFIRFLCNEWKKIYSRSKFEGTKMSLAYDEECLKVTTGNVEKVSYLRCSHEEADIQIFFPDKEASQSKDAIVVICEDTDVFSIAISKADIIGVSIYMKKGTQNRTRFVDITDVSTNLGSHLFQSIPGMHAFTGCDSDKTFGGKGKAAGLKVLRKHPSFQKTFSMFGEGIEVKYRSH